MEENKVCLVKLISGEPRIGKLSAEEGFEVQFVVPGLNEELLDVVLSPNSMIVTQTEDSEYSKAFSVAFVSEYIDFRYMDYERKDGVVTIICDIKDKEEIVRLSI